MGFIAHLTTIGSPVETPPSTPPARLVERKRKMVLGLDHNNRHELPPKLG